MTPPAWRRMAVTLGDDLLRRDGEGIDLLAMQGDFRSVEAEFSDIATEMRRMVYEKHPVLARRSENIAHDVAGWEVMLSLAMLGEGQEMVTDAMKARVRTVAMNQLKRKLQQVKGRELFRGHFIENGGKIKVTACRESAHTCVLTCCQMGGHYHSDEVLWDAASKRHKGEQRNARTGTETQAWQESES